MIRLTPEEYRRITGHDPPGTRPAPKPNKYGAQRTEYDGVEYSSKLEAKKARDLDRLLAAGEIRFWLDQVRVRLGPDVKYRVDFLVVGTDGQVWCIDTKGKETPRFRMIRRLWAKYGPCNLVISGRKRGEIIIGGKSSCDAQRS